MFQPETEQFLKKAGISLKCDGKMNLSSIFRNFTFCIEIRRKLCYNNILIGNCTSSLIRCRILKGAIPEMETANNKRKNLIIGICVVLAAVLVIGLSVYTTLGDNGTLLRGKTAAESENFEINGTMMAYFYASNYQNYYSYLSYLGVDPSVSLKSQPCSYLENGTWFDYFVSVTKSYTDELLALCEGAKAAGLALDDADQADIDATLSQLEATAKAMGYTADSYVTMAFGTGVKIKDVRACMEMTALASKFSNEFNAGLTYTAEEKEAYYGEHTADFEGVDYYAFTVNAGDFMAKDTEGNPVGDTTEASATAKAEAEKLAAAGSVDEFKSLIADYITANHDHEHDEATVNAEVESCFNYHKEASAITGISEWAFSAKAGDTHMTGADGDTAFNVYYLTKEAYRDETPTRNVRHILFTTDTYTDATKANEVYAEWEAAGFTEEKFIELAAQYNEDPGSQANGGLYENVAVGDMVNSFNNWLFYTAKNTGDHGIVESDYGWHIMYYAGTGEGAAWETQVTSALKNADYAEMLTANKASITYNDKVIADINA